MGLQRIYDRDIEHIIVDGGSTITRWRSSRINASNYDEICKNAREKIVREFDSVVVVMKYIELHQEVLRGS